MSNNIYYVSLKYLLIFFNNKLVYKFISTYHEDLDVLYDINKPLLKLFK